MKGYQNINASHVNLNTLLSSHNSTDILKTFSHQLLPLERARSENPAVDPEIEENDTPSELGLTKSQSTKQGIKKDQNFKVVVRVRPPLSREIDMHSGFTPVTQISQDNK
jgi:hypothetical protein